MGWACSASRACSTATIRSCSVRCTSFLWSFWIFLVLFFISLFAELIANDRPFLIKFDGHLYWPAFVSYSETTFGGDFETAADYRDPYLQKLIKNKNGSIVWPLIRYSYDTHNLDLPTPAPSKPTWMLSEAQCKD